MGGGTDSGPRRRIDAEVKARFVAALRSGAKREEAAAAEGFSLEAFYCARKRDDLFRLAWIWAMELSAVEARETERARAMGAAAADDPIQPNNRRPLQRRRRSRGIKFTDARRQMFLDHFALTADIRASADAAGIDESTVYKHRQRDPIFARGWDEAIALAYVRLEAGAVRERLEAMRRAALEPNPAGAAKGAGKPDDREFERVMQMLARLDRQGGRGVREARRGREKRWTFEESIEALDKALRALGVRHGVVPPGEEKA